MTLEAALDAGGQRFGNKTFWLGVGKKIVVDISWLTTHDHGTND